MIDTTAICPQITNNASANWIILLCKRRGRALRRKIIYQNILYDSANQLQPCLWPLSPLGTGRKGWVTLWSVGSQIQRELVSSLFRECLALLMAGLMGSKIRSQCLKRTEHEKTERSHQNFGKEMEQWQKQIFLVDCKLRVLVDFMEHARYPSLAHSFLTTLKEQKSSL